MKKITLSGIVGWDINPMDIQEKLDAAAGDDLDVKIASPGGSVIDGLEIFNMFRDYKRKNPNSQILATITGMAASMATYLALNPAFDLIAAEDNAVFMIHNVWGGAIGDYREMLKTAEIFQGLTGIIAKVYQDRTKMGNKKIRQMMDDETWLFGDEILKAGFVDEIIKTDSSDDDKAENIAQAKLKFKDTLNKISAEKIESLQIAAMIKNIEPEENYQGMRQNIMPNDVSKNVQNPAENNAGKKNITREVKTMTLEQLMAENPAAKIELDSKLKENFEAGFKTGKESFQATIKASTPFLKFDSQYPASIKNIAIDVLNGDKSVESLLTTVSAFDALKESQNSDNAKNESAGIGATPGQNVPQTTEDGIIKNEADFQAELVRSKKLAGMEV